MSVLCKAAGAVFTVLILVLFAATVAVMLTYAHDAYDRAKIKGEEEALAMAMGSGPQRVTATFTQVFADMQNISTALGNAYALDQVKCGDTALSTRTNQYLRTASATVLASQMITEVFAAYRLSTGAWAKCGCQAATNAAGVRCYFTNAAGTTLLNGADVTKVISRSTVNNFPDSLSGRAVAALTKADEKAGVWDTAFASSRTPYIQYVRPAMVAASGAVNEASGLVLKINQVAAMLNAMPDTTGDMVMLDTRDGGLFLGANNLAFETASLDRLQAANMTSSPRINEFVDLVRKHTTGFKPAGATAGFYDGSKALNFAVGGMIYSVRAVLGGRLMLLQRAPQVNSSPQVGVAVQELMNTLKGLASTLQKSYANNGVKCQDAAQHLETTQFFMQASMAVMKAFGANVVYNYASYKEGAIWGDCGCGRDGDGGFTCSYINGTGWYFEYSDADMSKLVYGPEKENSVAHQVYIQHISNLTRAQSNGVWIPPSDYSDPSTGSKYALATYSIPFEFEGNFQSSKATAAMSVDIAFADFATFLRRWNAVDGNELLLLDTTRSLLLADSRRSVDSVQNVLTTKYSVVNGYMREVVRQQGDLVHAGSFSDMNSTLYNVNPFTTGYAVVEVVRPEEQPAWFDPSGVTTKNAKARFSAAVKGVSKEVDELQKMFTSSEKAAMYILVGVTIILILIDRVLMLVLSGGSAARQAPLEDDYHKEALQGSV